MENFFKNGRLSASALRGMLLALLMALPVSSIAQDQLLPGETVRDRPRPELDATGIPVGSFRLLTSLDVGGMYDSNIYALPEDEIKDWIARVSPRLEMKSDWVRHALEMNADAEVVRFRDRSSEDVENYGLFARLTLEVTAHNRLRFSGRTARDHVDRTSPDDVGGFVPTPIDRRLVVGEYAYAGTRRLRLGLRGAVESLDYSDVPGPDGVVNNDDRDRTEDEIDLRLGFEINDGLEAAFVARSDTRDYDLEPSDLRLNRTSDGNFFGIGLNGTLNKVLFADVVLGRTSRDYKEPILLDVDATWYDGRIVWNPTGLTSVTLRATRDIRETIVQTASAYIATSFQLRVDHELRRNLLLYAVASTGNNDFQGLDRNDDLRGVALGTQYMVNRNFWVEAELTSRAREANQPEWAFDEFDKNTASITVRMQF